MFLSGMMVCINSIIWSVLNMDIREILKDEWLSVKECAELTGLTENTLRLYRTKGRGPKFSRIGYSMVLYDASAVEEWVIARQEARKKKEKLEQESKQEVKVTEANDISNRDIANERSSQNDTLQFLGNLAQDLDKELTEYYNAENIFKR